MLEKILFVLAAIGCFIMCEGILICLFIPLPTWFLTIGFVLCLPFVLYEKFIKRDF